nr:MAG: hypothetical protein H1Bulk296416_000002 [Mitovirus sp.]
MHTDVISTPVHIGLSWTYVVTGGVYIKILLQRCVYEFGLVLDGKLYARIIHNQPMSVVCN